MEVIVFGEISMDIIITTKNNIVSDDVLRGESYVFSCGGHGANQAIAMSRLGVKSAIVGRLGKDLLSKMNYDNLIQSNVNIDGIFFDDFENSGLAVLSVGQNRDFRVISFVEGVNQRIDGTDLNRFKSIVSGDTKIAVFQLGYPVEIVVSAMEFCRQNNITTILDPTPVLGDLPDKIYSLADYILPNQYEAEKITNIKITDISTAFDIAGVFHNRGSKKVIIKLGETGVIFSGNLEKFYIPSYKVNTKDTIGAGDAFIGGLVSGIIQNETMVNSVRWGVANAALCCSKMGAQLGLPSNEELIKFVNSSPSVSPLKY